MKKHPTFIAYILIGVGLYFVLKQYHIPFLSQFDTWPTLIILIGFALILHSITTKDHQHLFSGTIVLGLGIHFHGKLHYPGWIDHWAVYLFIIGVALFIRYLKSKKGLLIALLLIALSSMFMFSISVPEWLQWIYTIVDHLQSIWPFLLIVIGIYILSKR